jgi:hypothetical protein
MSKTPEIEGAGYLNKFAIKQNLDFFEKTLSLANRTLSPSTTQYNNTATRLM